MENAATCVLLNGLLSFALGLVALLLAFRLLGKRIGILLQGGVYVAALTAVNLGNALWWRFPSLQLQGIVPWLALLLFWSGLLYAYAIHFVTVARDGGPTYMLFRFIVAGPGGSRTLQEIQDHFAKQGVLSERIEIMVASGWLKRTARGHHMVTVRSRLVLVLFNGWSRLLGYHWGG